MTMHHVDVSTAAFLLRRSALLNMTEVGFSLLWLALLPGNKIKG
jgi:hypothetical protein